VASPRFSVGYSADVIKKLAAEQPTVAVEVVIKPVPVLNPAVAVPVDIGHVLGVVRVAPKIVQQPSIPPPFECSWGCILFGEVISPAVEPSIFIFQITIDALTGNVSPIILVASLFQNSTARSLDRGLFRLLSKIILPYFLPARLWRE